MKIICTHCLAELEQDPHIGGIVVWRERGTKSRACPLSTAGHDDHIVSDAQVASR